MRLIIENGTLLTPDATLPGYDLVIEEGRIASFGPVQSITNKTGDHVDAAGLYVIPGMIDLHIHGALGYDVVVPMHNLDSIGVILGNQVPNPGGSIAQEDQFWAQVRLDAIACRPSSS